MNPISFIAAKRERQKKDAQSTALDWFLMISENPDAEADCNAWRAADPAHEQAWKDVSEVWTRTAELGGLEREDWREEIDELTRRATFRRRRQWGFAIAASIVAAIGLGWFVNLPDAEYFTAPGQTRMVALQDGSQLTIGARSDVEIRFGEDERRVVLNSGQAFFEVAHDADRPFTVLAGDAEVRVTGTMFDVRSSEHEVTVSVSEGQVEVRHRPMLPSLGPDSPTLVLTKGMKSSLQEGAMEFAAPEKLLVPAGEWRKGRFFYQDATLSQIAWDAGRYSSVPIRITDPSIGQLKVTTSFQVDEVAQFLDNLTTILPIRRHVDGDGTITLEAHSVVE